MFANAVIAVTVQWQTARDGQSNILISYDVGGISHIMKMNQPGAAHVAPKTLFMQGAGMADYSIRSRMYGSACESSYWISDSIIKCKAAKGVLVGGNSENSGAVALTVFHFGLNSSGITSLTEAFSYDKAQILSSVVDIVERQYLTLLSD